MGEQTVRVGVIGCGVAHLHLRGYSRLEGVEIRALAGLEEERCRALAEEYHIPHRYTDYHDLLADPEIDAVSIALPNWLHKPAVIAALEAGKHVLVEKPLAATLADAEAIVQAAEQTDRLLMVCFNYRFRGDSQVLKRHIEAGGLGHVYYVKAGWMRRSGIPGLGSWFTSKEHSGGGPLIDLGVHVLDLALWLLGHPKPITVTAATYAEFGPRGRGGWEGRRRFLDGRAGFDVEDLAVAFMRLEGGITLVLETSWASYSSFKDDYYVHLFGSEGGAELTVREYTSENTLTLFGELDGVPSEMRPQCPRRHGHEEITRLFIESIRTGQTPPVTAAQGLTIMRLIDAIYRSAAERREVQL